ncbi:extracellular solute-binding protein [Paenibacillus aurantius]|uniref:Extracellular solute-binding protein n=1 Tax=Paenibacillus aurantius TaxID=2918900 RepID=A0AA96RCN0_9BACL|nr:extracellular solute-binding protein [Paenibacillus aurantius]WNQ08877.1 extracellular solute-binding protein [Paenibacillus aurantius]
MKRKKIALWAVSGAASLSLVSGCASNEGTKVEGKPADSGKQQQPIVIDWMNYPGAIMENSYGQTFLENKFNIKLKKVYPIAYDDYKKKQQLMLTSGEVPDVLFVFDPGDLNKYASQGLLAEVPFSTIEKYAPRTKANLDKQAPQGWFYSQSGGKNYGVPTFYYTGQFHTKQAWRTDLLQKAGITKIPETIDEMTQAFAALKKIGVYGMSSNGQSYYNQFHSLFGAFGVMPTQWMEKDGKVVNGAVQPEAKEALAVLSDWYKNGYIDPEFVTGKDLIPKFAAGKYAFMDAASATATDESDPNSVISAVKKVDPNGKVEFGPLPKGPRGQTGGWAWGTAGNIWAFGKQVEKDPAKLQKALEILDALQNDEQTWLALAWGEKGKHWDFKDPAKSPSGGLKRLSPYDDVNKLQAEGMPELSNGTMYWGGQPNLDLNGNYNANKEKAKLYNHSVSDIFGKSDILPSSGKFWSDLIKLKTETYAAIIRGDKPVSSFDDFVKQWNDKGGAQLEKEANEMYKQVKK